GYGRQVGRNVLQLNNGNQTFSEIGQYAGVAATDWSWGVLMADYDNDGWKDIFVSNGYRKDVTQFDYLNFFRDSIKQTGGLSAERFPDINQFIKFLPEQKIASYMFVHDRNLQFYDATKQAGMDQLKFSNGCAYADLDADGDLDLIVNNIDSPAFIYRNDSQKKNWLQIIVKGPKGNPDAIGAYADLYHGNNHQYQMVLSTKGFFSNSETILHFGLGSTTMVDSIILHWPDGSAEKMEQVSADQRIVWTKGSGKAYKHLLVKKEEPLFQNSNHLINWMHRDNDFVDSKRERLIPYNISSEGPCLAIGDINGDKLDDIYAGNGRGYSSSILFQTKESSFISQSEPGIRSDSMFEDCGAVLEDFDGDHDLDLVVISGGNDLPNNDNGYITRYYLNDGRGLFLKDSHFPVIRTNAGAVLAFDFDNDQDKDILIAGRCTPGRFPLSPKSYLLRNDKGVFTDITQSIFKACETLGMITDLDAGDLDGDGKEELVVCGEWIPIRVFSFNGKKFDELTQAFGLEKTNGWWKSVQLSDLDDDGDLDVLAGNLGLNNRFKTSVDYPITLVYNDFDGNGSVDPILSYYWQGKLYPSAGRDAILGQIPGLKKKYTRYHPYASATIHDIFTKEELDKSTSIYAYTFETTIFKNENKKLKSIVLPYQVQFSPIYDFVVQDFNEDGKKDILLAGNYLYSDTETGEMDAGNGALLLQQPDGTFTFVENRDHGFWAQREVRALKSVRLADGREAIITGNNRGPIEVSTCLKVNANEPVQPVTN
ncbi:MAG TPA: VCBS repeat-containing protein, partial [Saprospiraceae bacterium]|nr:VCBS repeat-containing protein [Saprospiraceae bacterium]